MKKIIFIALALALATTGCNDAKYDVIDNGLYLREAQDSKGIMVRTVSVDDDGLELTFTPAISKPVASDVTVEFGIDASVLEAYNLANESNYEVLPSQFYEMPDPVTIAAGSVNGDAVKLLLKAYVADDGVMYALPLTLKSTTVNALPTSSKYLILLDKPLIQSVPHMDYRTHLKCEPLNADGSMKEDWGLLVDEWSLEFWVWMDGFNVNNQCLFDSEDIYIRFGDAPIDNDLLQIKLRGTQVNTVTHFVPNTWYHIAFVYDATGLLTLYVNGAVDVTLQTAGGKVPINYMQMISSGSRYFVDRCRMAQVRFYSRAISSTQINANMYYSIKPTDDMIAYWRMDEGEGDVCKDCTGNGRHAVASYPLTWIDDVRFDGK